MTVRLAVWFAAVGVWMVGSGYVSGRLLVRLLAARRDGRVICRQVAGVEVGLWVVTVAGWVAIGLAVLGWRLGVASLGGVVLAEVAGVLTPLRASTGIYVWRRWRYHRPHDVDCEYGHSTSPRARVRLAGWRKVALRPGLAAS